MLDNNNPPLHIILVQNHLRDPVRQLVAVQNQGLDILGRVLLARRQLLLPRLVQALDQLDFPVQPTLDDGQLPRELRRVDVQEL
jgi:hypothetical protein